MIRPVRHNRRRIAHWHIVCTSEEDMAARIAHVMACLAGFDVRTECKAIEGFFDRVDHIVDLDRSMSIRSVRRRSRVRLSEQLNSWTRAKGAAALLGARGARRSITLGGAGWSALEFRRNTQQNASRLAARGMPVAFRAGSMPPCRLPYSLVGKPAREHGRPGRVRHAASGHVLVRELDCRPVRRHAHSGQCCNDYFDELYSRSCCC